MLNQVALIGRLTADIELRTTQSGLSSTSFTVAVTRNYKNQAGEYDSDFIRVVAWRQTAEYLSTYAKKGNLVSVSGRIQTGSYQNQQGQTVYTTDVVADNVQMLESRAQREGQASGGYNAGGAQASKPATTPDFGRQADPFASATPIEISDDDLPF